MDKDSDAIMDKISQQASELLAKAGDVAANAKDLAQPKASELAASAADFASTAQAKAAEFAQAAQSRAADAAGAASGAAQDAVQNVRDNLPTSEEAAEEARKRAVGFRKLIESNPLTAAIAALLIGFVLAKITNRSEG